MFQLPVSISHKSEPAVVPCHFPQEGEDKQQHLEEQDKHALELALKHIKSYCHYYHYHVFAQS